MRFGTKSVVMEGGSHGRRSADDDHFWVFREGKTADLAPFPVCRPRPAADLRAAPQVIDRHLHLGVDEHARAGHFPGALADRQGLLEVDLPGLQRVEHQVGGHQLGQRGGLHRAVDVLGRQDLVGRDVQQQIGARGDFRRLRRLGGSGECGQTQGHGHQAAQGIEDFFHGARAIRTGEWGGSPAPQRGQHPARWLQACRWRTTKCFKRVNCP